MNCLPHDPLFQKLLLECLNACASRRNDPWPLVPILFSDGGSDDDVLYLINFFCPLTLSPFFNLRLLFLFPLSFLLFRISHLLRLCHFCQQGNYYLSYSKLILGDIIDAPCSSHFCQSPINVGRHGIYRIHFLLASAIACHYLYYVQRLTVSLLKISLRSNLYCQKINILLLKLF